MPCDYRNNGPSYEQNNDGDWVSAYVSNFLIRGKGTSVSREVTVEPFAAAALRSVSTPRKANGLKLEGTCFNVWRVNGDADAVERRLQPAIAAFMFSTVSLTSFRRVFTDMACRL